jgi:type II secretory pathway pseudopilin PulG
MNSASSEPQLEDLATRADVSSGESTRTHFRSRSTGHTLIELAVVITIIAVVGMIATTRFANWSQNQNAISSMRSLNSLLNLARAEAMRTSHNQLVFFNVPDISGSDAAGNAIEDKLGNWVPALFNDDGLPADGDCAIDMNRALTSIPASDTVILDWGVTSANTPAPLDDGGPDIAGGITFATTTSPGDAVNGLLFRPDGIPVTFSANGSGCVSIGGTGSGGGALYTTNGVRDFAVVLTPLGGTRFHVWAEGAGAWSQ